MLLQDLQLQHGNGKYVTQKQLDAECVTHLLLELLELRLLLGKLVELAVLLGKERAECLGVCRDLCTNKVSTGV